MRTRQTQCDSCLFSMVLIAGMVLVASIAGRKPNTYGLVPFPEGFSTITVLVHDNTAYPLNQFGCSDVEAEGVYYSCLEGFGCDGQHYHGVVFSMGTLIPTGASHLQFQFKQSLDPDRCQCGWGKKGEADVPDISVFFTDIDAFFGLSVVPSIPTDPNLTRAQNLSADPCGG